MNCAILYRTVRILQCTDDHWNVGHEHVDVSCRLEQTTLRCTAEGESWPVSLKAELDRSFEQLLHFGGVISHLAARPQTAGFHNRLTQNHSGHNISRFCPECD